MDTLNETLLDLNISPNAFYHRPVFYSSWTNYYYKYDDSFFYYGNFLLDGNTYTPCPIPNSFQQLTFQFHFRFEVPGIPSQPLQKEKEIKEIVYPDFITKPLTDKIHTIRRCKYYQCDKTFSSIMKRRFCSLHECSIKGCYERAFLHPKRCIRNFREYYGSSDSTKDNKYQQAIKRYPRCAQAKRSNETCACEPFVLCFAHYYNHHDE